MRHRVFRALRASCSAYNIIHFWKAAEHVLNPMVDSIDLVKRSLRRKNGADQYSSPFQIRDED